ncbi:MAG: N-acetylmuramoyl-L-alanine amidase [Terriglobales bacterium]
MALLLLGLSPAAEEKRLAVYSAQTSFTIPVTDRDGQEYVSVTDLIDPFGNVTLTHKGDRWKLRLAANSGQNLEAEFTQGSEAAKIRGKKIQLTRPFWADGQRGYVPVASAPILMVQFTHQSANLRENSRRLFVGDVSTTYSAEISKNAPNKLVLHFSSPVNPTVSTEPGRVRLTFTRDPVIASGANPQAFDSTSIRSNTFSENNGSAELTVATTAPVLATFSDGGRTITLSATPAPAQAAQTQPKPATAATGTPSRTPQGAQSTQATTTAQAPSVPRFFVIIDPAHGGDDPGATLGEGLFEKDVTLAIARRIRADLDQRGIVAVLLREGDSTIGLDQRAIAANASRAALYVSVHATTFGTGVHLYSARFNGAVKLPAHSFLPWDSAQAAYLDASHNLAASLVTEFDSRQIQSVPLESGIRPLRNIAKPAIAIEVAEPATVPEAVKEGLTSIPYQQSVASAVASGIANLRSSMEGSR